METSLYDAQNGCTYSIVKMPEDNALESIGVFPGARVKIQSRYHFGGPIAISLGSRSIAIGKALATKIFVERCDNE